MQTYFVRIPTSGLGLRFEAHSEAHAALRAALWCLERGGLISVPVEQFEITPCEPGSPFETSDSERLSALEVWLMRLVASCPELPDL